MEVCGENDGYDECPSFDDFSPKSNVKCKIIEQKCMISQEWRTYDSTYYTSTKIAPRPAMTIIDRISISHLNRLRRIEENVAHIIGALTDTAVI